MSHQMYDPEPQHGDGGAAGMLKIPAIVLIVAGALGVLMYAGHSVLVLYQSKQQVLPANMTDPVQQKAFWAGFYGCFCYDVASIPMGLLLIWCAVCMLRLRGYRMAVFGAILAMMPTGSACLWPVALGMGIWAMVLLMKPEVKGAFMRNRAEMR